MQTAEQTAIVIGLDEWRQKYAAKAKPTPPVSAPVARTTYDPWTGWRLMWRGFGVIMADTVGRYWLGVARQLAEG